MIGIYEYIAVNLQSPENAMGQYNRIADYALELGFFLEKFRLLDFEPEKAISLSPVITLMNRMEMKMDTVIKSFVKKPNIELKPVVREDIETVWKMQVDAFSELLEKYRDFETNPAAESVDKVLARFEQPWTTYYFIMADNEKVGVIRVVDKKDGSRKRISPIWIMTGYQNKGYAQQAILEAEKIYGPDHWCLDTILQEKGNLHLYEKLGYHRTGRIDKINDRMDIVYYEKD